MVVDLSVFFISSMCIVLLGGGEDCDYHWVTLPSDILNELYLEQGGKHEPGMIILAFYQPTYKTIYLDLDWNYTYIDHELKHAQCIEYYKSHENVNHHDCVGHFIYG